MYTVLFGTSFACWACTRRWERGGMGNSHKCGMGVGMLHLQCRFSHIFFALHTVQGVWDRALGLPIERPKSITSDWIEKKFGKV